jgi:vitellogenic carboxypeptidase-like protein
LLWLQGGPGASSLFGLFVENGPYRVDEKLNVNLNNYSWTQNFSMLYIDNPVGSGFSFTQSSQGFAQNEQNVADDLYEALQQFFTLFSEYRNNNFYLTGESYAGKFIPAIGYKLHTMANTSNINFKGIAIGNGFIDPINMLDIGSFLYKIGLIDENQLQHFYLIQNRTAKDIVNGNFSDAFIIYGELLGKTINFL